MAEVWLAHDERLERNVAVKFMAANLCDDAEFLVRFFSEAQTVARISHPNVVAVLDFGDFQERPYLVMKCAPGDTLSDLTDEPMLPERATEIVVGAARGAGAAHAVGLVHRDVKPGNILLDDEGRAKLSDFGIASSSRSEKLTATGTAIGSPHYISPEQASGRAVTAASDVYSLGAVLYELLTGRPPFDGDNVTAIAIAHVEQAPVPPSALVPGLPAQLDDIVLACLAKDPDARPRDGAALAAALETGHYPDAPSWIPVPAAGVEPEPEDDYELVPKRRLVPALLALSLLIALGSVIYVSGRPKDVAEAGTNARRSTAKETPRPDRSATSTPTPAPEGTGAEAVTLMSPAATPTPTPRSEEQEQEEQQEAATPTPEPDDYEGSFWTPEPSDEPTPPPSEEPEPTAPPPDDPTPAP